MAVRLALGALVCIAAATAPATRTFTDPVVGVGLTCPAGLVPTVNPVAAADIPHIESFAFAVFQAKRYKIDYVYVRKPKGQDLAAFVAHYLKGDARTLSRESLTVGGRPAVLARRHYADGPEGAFHSAEAIALSKPELALVQVAYMPDASVTGRDATYREAVTVMRTSVRFLEPAEPAYRPDAGDVAAMRAAIRVADGVKGGPCAERFGFTPTVEAKGFVLGETTCAGTDPAWVILKRAGKGWKVVVLGTGLTGRELRGMGVPEELAKRFDPSRP